MHISRYCASLKGPEFYPGTGYDDITGVESNIVNVSMEHGDGSDGFRKAYSESILPALEAFRPDLIVISAGEIRTKPPVVHTKKNIYGVYHTP